jgi:hypothetical protein
MACDKTDLNKQLKFLLNSKKKCFNKKLLRKKPFTVDISADMFSTKKLMLKEKVHFNHSI